MLGADCHFLLCLLLSAEAELESEVEDAAALPIRFSEEAIEAMIREAEEQLALEHLASAWPQPGAQKPAGKVGFKGFGSSFCDAAP